MKILAIGGKNLASLAGEFRIDFRTEPLRSAGLFAITGSTGSGKTTILDAMCIALYERTPRLENIRNGEAIESYGNTGLNESDPKTILSKGAHEGYAETEFVAVDGKEYRVRWSVSRTNDNANGRFRKTAYDIFNLTDGTHERYGKREYTAIMPTLIGLTYEEFTRAVLLAQGNFAAFLKAGENEKAAILQKLTGTEVYGRISSLIYSHTVEARKELDLIEAQRNGITLLAPEEIDGLNSRKAELERQNEEHERRLQRLTAEKQWIERHTQLEKELLKAEEENNAALHSLEQNRPIAERLARIDSVQEIRDTYLQMTVSRKLCEENKKMLVALKEKANTAWQALRDSTKLVELAEKKTGEIQAEYDIFKPRISAIIKAEEEIRSCTQRIKETNAAIARNSEENLKLSTLITDCHERIGKNSKERAGIDKWFTENKEYEDLIPNIPVITTNIRFVIDTRKQIAMQQKLLAETSGMLARCEKEHAELKKREEELAKTLSSEIAELRSRLSDGEPCPVCGSRTHDITLCSGKTLAEEELEKAKQITADSIENLAKSIENHKDGMARQQSMIETLTDSIHNIRKKNISLLKERIEIKEDEETVLRLQALAGEWDKNVKRLVAIKEETSVAEKSIELSSARSAALNKEAEENTAHILAANDLIKKSKEQLTALLGKWKNREEAEEYFAGEIANANKAVSEAAEKNASNASDFNRFKGNIEEKENLLATQKERFKVLSSAIATYLAERSDNMSIEELERLLAPENDVSGMRAQVERTRNCAVKAAATLEERKRSIENHLNDNSRPQGDCTMDEVTSAIADISQLRAVATEEINGINAHLLKNKENVKIFGQYSEVYDKKQKIATDWSELNAVFGSANGDKLTRLTQGYTLDILLDVANIHLKEFSGRYLLSRISADSLGIKVIDLEMMSDSRSVHSLSGGETFLASLALSLALSSVSSNKMDIETLFIDEGFGALDSDTLKEAIDVLEKLQDKGRKIGVISHLSEMLERIPTRIKVTKRGNGKSKITIE